MSALRSFADDIAHGWSWGIALMPVNPRIVRAFEHVQRARFLLALVIGR